MRLGISGFIVHKLRKKNKNLDFRVCLQNMTIETAGVTDAADSMKWTLQTNRGGLKLVSDDVHSFFKEVEMKSFPLIEQSFKICRTIVLSDILIILSEDPDIQYFWETVSMDMPEDYGDKLLEEILKEWIVTRGHSIGKKFMEDYKVATKAARKKQSLRKELKKCHDDTSISQT